MSPRLFVHKQVLCKHTLSATWLAGPCSKQATLHAHTARETGHISRLIAVLHPRTGKVMKARPRVLLPGQTAIVEVRLTAMKQAFWMLHRQDGVSVCNLAMGLLCRMSGV